MLSSSTCVYAGLVGGTKQGRISKIPRMEPYVEPEGFVEFQFLYLIERVSVEIGSTLIYRKRELL